MSTDDRERTASELLKHRIVGETGEKLATAGKAMFDLFTGGAEAVLDAVAQDFEDKKKGGAGIAMPERYRCADCNGVHTEGTGCDALPVKAPPPRAVAPSQVIDTTGEPMPHSVQNAHAAGAAEARSTRKIVAYLGPAELVLVCASCLEINEDARIARDVSLIDDVCSRCAKPACDLPALSLFRVRKE